MVHQVTSPLINGDGLHDLSCTAVMAMIGDVNQLMSCVEDGAVVSKKAHKTTGKLWTNNDWHPPHFRLIYETYNDQIVDALLNGGLGIRELKLHTQF